LTTNAAYNNYNKLASRKWWEGEGLGYSRGSYGRLPLRSAARDFTLILSYLFHHCLLVRLEQDSARD